MAADSIESDARGEIRAANADWREKTGVPAGPAR
jgi:hypothetical protein